MFLSSLRSTILPKFSFGKINSDRTAESGVIDSLSFVSVGADNKTMVVWIVRFIAQDKESFFDIYGPFAEGNESELRITARCKIVLTESFDGHTVDILERLSLVVV